MGYYTNYRLEIQGKTDIDHSEEIQKQTGYYISEDYSEDYKWYDNEDDMKLHSSQHPDLLFVLYGEGEESGDLWVKYFKNGKMQRCNAIITYEEFDESKLQ